jgi:hypothetical protein
MKQKIDFLPQLQQLMATAAISANFNGDGAR